jgi:branched-subunit amino acid transport protein
VTFWIALAGMVAVTFGSRYAVLALRAELPGFWVRFLHLVPISVFAALVTPSLEAASAKVRSASSGRW